jgi:hypothetical protein
MPFETGACLGFRRHWESPAISAASKGGRGRSASFLLMTVQTHSRNAARWLEVLLGRLVAEG